MPLKTGTMTWRTFRIEEGSDCSSLNREQILEGLEKEAFRDPDVDAGEVESEGFVVFDELLNTEFKEASEQTFVGAYVMTTFRKDRLRVPAAYFKALVEAELTNIKARTGSDTVGRAQKNAVREEIERMLLKRALPAIQKAEIVWSLQDNTVRIFAGSAGLVEAACEAFETAFESKLLPREAFTHLLESGWTEEQVEKSPMPAAYYLPALMDKAV
tara:strand:- start:206 stop:850 length:645 start_codon:yes stop_codon:yes gene_type:complete